MCPYQNLSQTEQNELLRQTNDAESSNYVPY